LEGIGKKAPEYGEYIWESKRERLNFYENY